jgi:acyl carrier protein
METNEKIINFLEEFLTEESGETIKLSLDSKLFGGGGPLDSMALVSLVVELEEYIEDEFGITVTLADEKAMSRRTSPFSRVSNLVNYINEKINNG